ncbi:head GIN domain-containing protein [soil metagenome]
MKNILLALTILLVATSLSSCKKGNGNIRTRSLVINNFNEINLNVDADVYVRQGNTREITVTGEENVLDRLDGSVKDNEWDIEFTRNFNDYEKLEIYITMPDIRKLKVSSSGNIIGLNTYNVNKIDLEVTGSGIIEVGVDADDEVKNTISGSGDIRVSGATDKNKINISGSGSVRSYALISKDVDATISGSGDAQVHATNNLKARLSGSGNVRYHGSPDTDIETSGSGVVVREP